MDAMNMAKKQVLADLIKDMHRRMASMGESPAKDDTPETIEERAEDDRNDVTDAQLEAAETPEEDGEPAKPNKRGVTITMEAIKKGSPFKKEHAPAPSAEAKLPGVVEQALMGKEKDRFKKKA